MSPQIPHKIKLTVLLVAVAATSLSLLFFSLPPTPRAGGGYPPAGDFFLPRQSSTPWNENLIDFSWNGIGSLDTSNDPLGLWSAHNILPGDTVAVTSMNYGGADHDVLWINFSNAGGNQNVTLDLPYTRQTDSGNSTIEFDYRMDDLNFQHFMKLRNSTGDIIAEIDQGSANNFSLMIGDVDGELMFQTLTAYEVNQNEHYRLQWVIINQTHQQLNCYNYSGDTWSYGEIMEMWLGTVRANEITSIEFSRQGTNPNKYMIANVNCDWLDIRGPRVAPITVTSESELLRYVSGGAGTAGDPWVIQKRMIESNGTGSGMVLQNVQNVIVRDFYINETGSGASDVGIGVQQSDRVQIENTIIESTGATGVAVVLADEISLNNNVINITGGQGLYMDSVDGVAVSNMSINGTGAHGIMTSSVYGAFVTNAEFTNLAISNATGDALNWNGGGPYDVAGSFIIGDITGNHLAFSIFRYNTLNANFTFNQHCNNVSLHGNNMTGTISTRSILNVTSNNFSNFSTLYSSTDSIVSSFDDNAYDDYFVHAECATAITVNSTHTLETPYPVTAYINDTSPRYVEAWWPRSDSMNLTLYNQADLTTINVNLLHVYIDGVRLTSGTHVISHVLFNVTVENEDGLTLYSGIHNINETADLWVGIEYLAAVYFSFYSTVDWFGLDNSLIRMFIDGSRVNIFNPLLYTNQEYNVTIRDFANVTLYTTNITPVLDGLYIDIGLDIAPVIVQNGYNHTVIFRLKRNNVTITYTLPRDSSIMLRLGMGNYDYIVTHINGTQILATSITISATSTLSFGWVELELPPGVQPDPEMAAAALLWILIPLIGASLVPSIIAIAIRRPKTTPPSLASKQGRGVSPKPVVWK